MEGTKIKNIVIIILLLLNGFLLVLVGGRWAQDTQSRDVARSSAIQVIRESGIELEETAVPREMTLGVLQARRDLEQERTLAAGLLGGNMTVEARGGEVYRYHSPLGWVQFHSTGEFLAEFEPGAFAAGEEDETQHGARLLQELGFENRVLQKMEFGGQDSEDSDRSITYLQTVNGAPVPDCQATLHYQKGILVSMGGRRVPGRTVSDGETNAVSVATALMRLYNGLNELGDVYNRIDSIESAYTLNVNLSGTAQLTPVWLVKTDTGAYQLDAHAGQLSRVSRYTAALTSDPES